MKAIIINEDKTLSWSNVETPVEGVNEVLIEVYAAAVNRADLLQVEGKYPPPKGCPTWPGLEVSGIIKSVGRDTKKFKVGDKVCALLGGGGYAEYVTVTEDMVMHIPNGLSFEEAAAIPEVYATAYLNLFRIGNLKAGETLFITGGNSGLSSAIIPIAKMIGARVITTVRGGDKVRDIEYLNVDRIIDVSNDDLSNALMEEYENGHPIDVAIDCLGGNYPSTCLKYAAQGCRWIQIATLTGDISPIDFRNIYVKNIKIIGSTLRNKTAAEKGDILRELENDIFPYFLDGSLKVKVCKVLPITQADTAHKMLYDGKNIGKVVLKVRD